MLTVFCFVLLFFLDMSRGPFHILMAALCFLAASINKKNQLPIWVEINSIEIEKKAIWIATLLYCQLL